MQPMSSFRLGKYGKRHCLIDPQGRPFFSLGIVHVGAYPEREGRAFFEGKYGGDWTNLTPKIVSDLRNWGFNTAGYHSPLTMLDHMPFMRDSYPAAISYWMGEPAYPDVFDPAYRRQVQEQLERLCAPVRDHANLIGYYWTDTPRWDLDRARSQVGTDWVSAIRSLPPSAPGKRRYVAYLCGVCREAAEMQVYTKGAMPAHNALLQSDFSRLDLDHPVVRHHDRGFLHTIARRYYRTAFEATRHADPDHLLFGDRYLVGDLPPEVLEEALPFVDALSVQSYGTTFDRAFFDGLYARTGKPILICDHAINFPTNEHPETLWPQCPSEQEAARAYAAYLWALFERPYMLGYHRCQYIDRVIPDGSTLKQGFLRADETPYNTLLDQVRKSNRGILTAFQELEQQQVEM
jgi:hypothetical protein